MSEQWKRGDWFQTFSGKQFVPTAPTEDTIDIVDIAHALSLTCRFNGHTKFHYSVAQHSLLVMAHVPPEFALEGLMHDASEAYLGDMVRPLKRALPAYQELEEQLEKVIAMKFGLRFPYPAAVKEADNRALLTERRDVLRKHAHLEALWSLKGETFAERIEEMAPSEAERRFLAVFEYLTDRGPDLREIGVAP